ncbi:MAG: DUF370 domain-containing protein [Clostridiales bacterium]|jgi:hypothetical protein|nr:DUF370 domain-containing protein [Clostridiales bacterium]
MYLYIGGDKTIRMQDVVAVIDIENTTTSKHTRKFLAAAEERGNITETTKEMPKSFVVESPTVGLNATEHVDISNADADQKVYLCGVHTSTINQRSSDR